MAGGQLRRGSASASASRSPSTTSRSRSPTASSSCWSGRRARARRRRCGLLAGLEAVTAGQDPHRRRATSPNVAPRERDIAMVFQDYALYPADDACATTSPSALQIAQDAEAREIAAPRARGGRRARPRRRCSSASRASSRAASGSASPWAARSCASPQVVPDGRAALEPRREAARRDARRDLKRCSSELGTTTVYVTHDQVEAMTMGDRIAVMRDGVLEQVRRRRDEVYDAPGERVRRRLHRQPGDDVRPVRPRRADGSLRLTAGPIGLTRGGPRRTTGHGHRRRPAGARAAVERRRRAAGAVRGDGRVDRGARPRDLRRRASGRRAGVRSSALHGAASTSWGELLEFGIEPDRAMLFDPESEAAIGGQGGAGWKNRWAIAVGTIAESTTTVSRSENWVRSMIPALQPVERRDRAEREPGGHEQRRERGVRGAVAARERVDAAELRQHLRRRRAAPSTPRFAHTAPSETFRPPLRKKNGVRNANATTRSRSCSRRCST